MSLSGGCAESVMMPGMVIDMEEARLQTIAQVRAFLDGATEITFRVPKVERYPFIERVLTRFGYAAQGRVGKGVLLRYLVRLTGLSRQQVTRLVRQYRQDGMRSTRHGPPQHGFRGRFTATDVAVLADMDALHGTVSGPATKKLMERALLIFGDARFERLAGISVSHLYNLRGGKQFAEWTDSSMFFVTRMKDNALFEVVEEREPPQNRNILKDQTIRLTSTGTQEKCPHLLRRVEAIREDTGDILVFLTNHLSLGAGTIAAIYKDRWQLELFFKTLKQNLKIKTFVGTSANAVAPDLDGIDLDAVAARTNCPPALVGAWLIWLRCWA